MLNLVRTIRMIRTEPNPPTSNDPYVQRRYNKRIWDQRNYVDLGRGIMAWLAIAGWGSFVISILF